MEKAEKSKGKQYIYITKQTNEFSRCKIGITTNLSARLKIYNGTGNSIDNQYLYLFTCEVEDMRQLEKDIKKEFTGFREVANKEMYFFNEMLFEKYVNYIKEHPLFLEEIFIKKEEPEEKIKYKTKEKPSLKEQGLSQKDVMQQAQKVKDDEFYTRLEDIEKEIAMYDKEIWKDKCVFCNCDDAVDNDERRTSAFALFFLKNFKELQLKKLICTHYTGGDDIFRQGANGYIFTKEGWSEIKEDYDNMKLFPTKYNGSFDHPISIRILNEEADIVCTNPPFSRAREYYKLIIESGKKFLIIGNFTNAKNDAYIPYFIDKKIWFGHFRVGIFQNPKRETVQAPAYWFTNFPVINRPRYKFLKLMPIKDIPDKYKRWDDSGTLLIDKCFIPNNYKHPFAISPQAIFNGLLEKDYKIVQKKQYRPYINGKEVFARVLVQKIVC